MCIMARYSNFIKFYGSIDGLTFYDGEDATGLVKAKNRSYQPTKEGTLRNMSEFGSGSTMCKHFRNSFLTVAKQFGGQDTFGRFIGAFRNVIDLGTGILGHRDLDLKAHPEPVLGLQFQKHWSVRQALRETLLNLEMNETRDVVRWVVPDFVPREHIKAPELASHFQLVLVATQVSRGHYKEITKNYVQETPVEPHSGTVVYSEVMELRVPLIDGFTLIAVPGPHKPTPESVAVVVCAGVLFSRMVGDKLVAMKDGRAMDVVGIN